MSTKLPPLNALRAFEAAARLSSFKVAAQEMNLTPAAVGYQVRRLEQQLGKKLFHRRNRALILTDEGKSYAMVVNEAFGVLRKGSELLSGGEAARSITVRVPWSLSSKWLMCRLGDFHQHYPHWLVRIDSRDDPADFTSGVVDIALSYNQRPDHKLHSELLFSELVFPVCCSRLLNGSDPLHEPSDIRHHTLLHDMMPDITWEDWLRTADVTGVDVRAGPVISHSALTLDAALAGEGIALARSPLALDDLEHDRLVQPFAISMVSSWGYYLECLPERADELKIRAFRDWVLQEARRSEAASKNKYDARR